MAACAQRHRLGTGLGLGASSPQGDAPLRMAGDSGRMRCRRAGGGLHAGRAARPGSRALRGRRRSQRTVARALDAACRDHGFVALRNVGVDRALLAAAWNASEALFAMKSEDKARLEPWAAATNRGYSPPGRERLNARRKTREPKEAFNVKGAGNQYDAAPSTFGAVADELWRVLVVEAAKRYAVAAALALDLPRDFFSKTLQQLDLCTLRFLHYPALPPSEEDEVLRAGEHTDFGFATFLFIKGGAAGLQMKSVDGGEVAPTRRAAGATSSCPRLMMMLWPWSTRARSWPAGRTTAGARRRTAWSPVPRASLHATPSPRSSTPTRTPRLLLTPPSAPRATRRRLV